MKKGKKYTILTVVAVLLLFLNVGYLSGYELSKLVSNIVVFLFILISVYEIKKHTGLELTPIKEKIIKYSPIISGVIVMISLIYFLLDLQLNAIYIVAGAINLALGIYTGIKSSHLELIEMEK